MVELPSSFQDIELILLDMDGVLTSEEAYWDAAGLVVQDILESPALLGLSPPHYSRISALFYSRLAKESRKEWRKYLPPDLILNFKTRGINSNWDLAYLTVGMYLAVLFASPLYVLASSQEENQPLSDFYRPHLLDKTTELRPTADMKSHEGELKKFLSPVWEEIKSQVQTNAWASILRLSHFHLWGDYFRWKRRTVAPVKGVELRIMDDFHPDIRGLRLLDELNTMLCEPGRYRWSVFGRNTALWEDCRDLFQGWYLGEKLYESTYGRPLLYTPKPGLVHREEPLHGRTKTHACLTKLREAGYTLGIATGRPRMEILTPLATWDMAHYFDGNRILTHDEVEKTENQLKQAGIEQNLGKPHPYVFLQAIYPERDPLELAKNPGAVSEPRKVLIVGDAPADVWAAQKISCPCAAVLSGALGSAGKRHLEETKPDVICRDLLELTDLLISLKRACGKSG